MAVKTEEFKQGMQKWVSGVAVVTTQNSEDAPQGMTVTSFCSVSADPPQVLVCINRETSTGEAIKVSQRFGVNILTSGQEEISNLFASPLSPEERFSKVEFFITDHGTPLFSTALATFECRVINMYSAGTHDIVVGEVEQIKPQRGDPLCYFNAGYRGLNHPG